MKELTEYISEVLSPFDEDIADDQIMLNKRGYIQYQQDVIVNNIGYKDNKQNIDLFFEDLIENLKEEQKQVFYKKILHQIIKVYYLNYLQFYNEIKDLVVNNQKEIIDLIKFLEGDQYIDYLSQILPSVPIECNQNKNILLKFIIDNVFIIQEQTKMNSAPCPYLLKICFIFSSMSDIINCLVVLLSKDVLSVIVKQQEGKLK